MTEIQLCKRQMGIRIAYTGNGRCLQFVISPCLSEELKSYSMRPIEAANVMRADPCSTKRIAKGGFLI